MKRLVVAAGLAVVLGAAACSSSTGGAGEPVGINRQSSSASPSGSTTPATSSAAPATSANASTIAPPPAPPRTTTAPSTPTTAATPTTPASSASPTPSPTVLAQIASVDATGTCNGVTTGTGNGSMTVTWTTLGADEVWLLPGSVASVLVGANAKSGKGPFPANGSTTLTGAFNCGDTTNYVLVQAFKGDGTGSPGQVTAVNRN